MDLGVLICLPLHFQTVTLLLNIVLTNSYLHLIEIVEFFEMLDLLYPPSTHATMKFPIVLSSLVL